MSFSHRTVIFRHGFATAWPNASSPDLIAISTQCIHGSRFRQVDKDWYLLQSDHGSDKGRSEDSRSSPHEIVQFSMSTFSDESGSIPSYNTNVICIHIFRLTYTEPI